MEESIVQSVYHFIHTYLEQNQGLSPTMREVAKGCHIHLSTAAHAIDILQAQGRLTRKPNTSRSIRLMESI